MDPISSKLYFAKTHEWARLEGNEIVMGISDHAQTSLGDITFVQLPKCGVTFTAGEPVGVIESVKAASDIYAPVSGEVVAVNEQLATAPDTVNQSPYEAGWLVRFRMKSAGEVWHLLTAEEYRKHNGA